MTSLDRKLLRDLWRLKTQVLAIALVIGSGAALLILALTNVEALEETTDAYYERTRFADVFAQVKRAPERLARRIAEIPGVRDVETRISHGAILDLPGFEEPVVGQMISLPESGPQVLNALFLRSGRLPDPARAEEVVVNEPFAEAHGFGPGDRFVAILNGRKRELRIVGTVLSPEFVYAIAPGALLPDDERFGIVWMNSDPLSAAYDLEGSFNDVALGLRRDAMPEEVVRRLDRILEDYGGRGAYTRDDQISNWFLRSEIEQQANMAQLMPAIFLAVAAFLTNIVMARLIATERHAIGLLKAFGYSAQAIAWHYAKFVLVVATLGFVLGAVAGVWLGHWNTEIYAEFYRFPFLLYRPGPESFLIAAIVSFAASLAGSLSSVWRAAALPPATAMLPPAPPSYRRDWISRRLLAPVFDEPTRMVIRHVLRWPLRSFLASTGLAFSVAVLVLSLQWIDAVDYLAESVFVRGQHQDATVGFNELQGIETATRFGYLPGVLAVEPFRSVDARFRNGHVVKRQGVMALPADAELGAVIDTDGREIGLPAEGLLLSEKLAEVLGVAAGDVVTLEILEGRRATLQLTVLRTFDTYIGTPAYMRLDALNRAMEDGRVISGVNILIDQKDRAALLGELKEIANVAGIQFRQAGLDKFQETMAETVLIFVGFFVAFAATLSVGVAYNSIRIALSERGRELATLRVLGFSRWEISYILLGEIGVVTWIAMPLGCLIGFGLAAYLTNAFATELYRIPLVIEDATYGVAVLITLASIAACAGLVRRRVDRLDMIAVLKTRE